MGAMCSARLHYAAKLEAAGLAPERCDLLPLAPGNAEHLGTYGAMDVSLDPWPYAGTTTTAESLLMGVPCVTLAGMPNSFVPLHARADLGHSPVLHAREKRASPRVYAATL